ncbi:MAG: dihydrolipoamide dehydrogenase [Alphaproteobacteria bacterium 41-28]|nr:MAG: dihydrolipoamide dehydrogenase [Alphaproteobacteria bacterium 41-28]
METLKVDLCVIGAGSGGLSVAAGAAQLGASVVLIEAHKMGGDCLNYGCVPSKSLLAAAKRANVFRTSGAFGIQEEEPKVNFEKLQQHIQNVITTIAPQDSVERFEGLGVHVIRERASFLSPTLVQAGNTQIKAKYFVISTGSSPAIVPLPGIENIPYLTNETIFNLKEKPDHLIVVGGGPIGCEIAQAYRLLGVKTTILEAFTLLPREDPEIVDILRQRLKADGLNIIEKAKVLSVSQKKKVLYLEVEHEGKEITLEGSHLLMATGRKPNVDHLGLEEAGVRHTPKGITVDGRLRTTHKKIYALGDVIGGYQFTHMASYQAGVVIKNCLFHLPSKVNDKTVPWVTFTDPEVAHVGLTHQQVPPHTKTLYWPYKDSDRAQAERETTGLIKVFTTPKGQILGVSIIGANAGELILPWSLAIEKNLKLRALADAIVPYPTLSEINKRVAGSFYTPLLFSPFTRKIVRFLMKVVP